MTGLVDPNLHTSLVESVPAVLLASTLRGGRLRYINQFGLAKLHYEHLKVQGVTLEDLQLWVHAREYYDLLSAVTDGAEPTIRNAAWRTARGEILDMLVACRVVAGHNEPLLVCIGLDMTQQRGAERQQIREMLFEERVRLLGDFIGDISHDLKTLITTQNVSSHLVDKLADRLIRDAERLQQRSEVTGHPLLEADVGSIIESALKIRQHQATYLGSTRDLQRVIENMLVLLKVSENPAYSRITANLNDLMESCLHGYLPIASRKRLAVRFLHSKTPILLAVDATEMCRALGCLIENAVQYTEPGGEITVRIQAEGAFAIIEIEDTGIGIAAHDLPHIFEPFYRADKSRPVRGGSAGFGLAIARAIVYGHDGIIDVESTPGEGSIFRVKLPLPPTGSSSQDAGSA